LKSMHVSQNEHFARLAQEIIENVRKTIILRDSQLIFVHGSRVDLPVDPSLLVRVRLRNQSDSHHSNRVDRDILARKTSDPIFFYSSLSFLIPNWKSVRGRRFSLRSRRAMGESHHGRRALKPQRRWGTSKTHENTEVTHSSKRGIGSDPKKKHLPYK